MNISLALCDRTSPSVATLYAAGLSRVASEIKKSQPRLFRIRHGFEPCRNGPSRLGFSPCGSVCDCEKPLPVTKAGFSLPHKARLEAVSRYTTLISEDPTTSIQSDRLRHLIL